MAGFQPTQWGGLELLVRPFMPVVSEPSLPSPPAEETPDAFIKWGGPAQFDHFEPDAQDPLDFGVEDKVWPLEGKYVEECRKWTDFKITNPEDKEQWIIIRKLDAVAFKCPPTDHDPPVGPAQLQMNFKNAFTRDYPNYLHNSQGEEFEPIVLDPFHTIVEVHWQTTDFVLISVLLSGFPLGAVTAELLHPVGTGVFAPGYEYGGGWPTSPGSGGDPVGGGGEGGEGPSLMADPNPEPTRPPEPFMEIWVDTVQENKGANASESYQAPAYPSGFHQDPISQEYDYPMVYFNGEDVSGSYHSSKNGIVELFVTSDDTSSGSSPGKPYFIPMFPAPSQLIPVGETMDRQWRLDIGVLNTVYNDGNKIATPFGFTSSLGLFSNSYGYFYREWNVPKPVKYDSNAFWACLLFVDVSWIMKFFAADIAAEQKVPEIEVHITAEGIGAPPGTPLPPKRCDVRWVWYKGSVPSREAAKAIKSAEFNSESGKRQYDEKTIWDAFYDGSKFIPSNQTVILEQAVRNVDEERGLVAEPLDRTIRYLIDYPNKVLIEEQL